MKCPFCKAVIDDDSRYCDQCGKELHFCPECRVPKRGTECAVCGSTLVGAAEFFGDVPGGRPSPPREGCAPVLSGNGWRIALKEGIFGRTEGVIPEFSSCIYVSGRHGEFRRGVGGEWTVMDFGSTNGTYINGNRLAPDTPSPLRKGDRIKIATLTFDVE